MIARILNLSLVVLLALPIALAQTASQSSPEELIRDGNFYFAIGDCQLAQLLFQRALEAEPDNTEAMLGKGKALVCQGATDLGIAEYQRVIEADSGNITAYIQLARAYENQYLNDPQRYPQRLNDALTILSTVERIDDQNVQVFNTKGVILYQMGDFEGAKTALEKAVNLASAPDSGISQTDLGKIQINLGKSYRELGQLQLALSAFMRAVTLDPTDSAAHNNLGNIYFRLDDCNQAIFELTQAANLNPRSLSAVSQLGIAQFECEQVADSIPRLQQAIDIDGVSIPALHTYLARAYLEQGRLDNAVLSAQKGALLPPVSAEALYWLGQSYEARNNPGDLELAREAYKRALEVNPNYRPAQEALDKLP